MGLPGTVSDERLLIRASRGDESAFLLLYERHRTAIYRFAFRMTGTIGVAEDITQDCFLSLIEHPQRFRASRASLRTYLFAAARNLALKYHRKFGSEITVDEIADEQRQAESQQPLGKLLDEELSIVVREAVARLPLLQREALILFEYEELTLVEIGAIVGTDVGTVKARLYRARQRLRKLLEPYMKGASQGASMER